MTRPFFRFVRTIRCQSVQKSQFLLAGGLGTSHDNQAMFCLPGTHSKWIFGEKGRIERLTTFMTGELFHLMKTHSISAPFIDVDSEVDLDSPAFADGLALAESQTRG